MNTRRQLIAFFLLSGAILECAEIRAFADQKHFRVWSARGISVRARATFVNRCFTNGTPMRTIVAALGTNYIVYRPISGIWAGRGPEPRKTSGLIYSFGEDCVTIGTTAAINADPLTGEFTGAGYSFHATPDSERTLVWIPQREEQTEPMVTHLDSRSFFVDPYQFNEVIRPKLPLLEEDNLDGTDVFPAVQWFAQLGVEINQTNGNSVFWHDDGRLWVRASSADLHTIESAITAMGKEYSGKPHPRLEICVIPLAPDAFEEGLRKLRLLSEAATNSPTDVRAAVLRRFTELGADLARPKTFHYDRSKGYLAVCATRADLDIIEPEVVRLQVTPAQPLLRRM